MKPGSLLLVYSYSALPSDEQAELEPDDSDLESDDDEEDSEISDGDAEEVANSQVEPSLVIC